MNNHGTSWWWGMFTLVICLLIAGCYDVKLRTQDRLDGKVADFSVVNGREPNAEELAKLRLEATKEEAEARRGEIDAAKRDAVSGAVGIATGNYIAGGVLLIGAIGTFLGLNRGKKVKPVPPSGGTV